MEHKEHFQCTRCTEFVSKNYLFVLHHIGLVHAFEADFEITCGLEDCSRCFKKYRSYRKHILNHHKHIIHQQSFVQAKHFSNSSDVAVETSSTIAGSVEDLSGPLDKSTTSISVPLYHDTISKHKAALFLLKARECWKMSQTVLELVDDIQFISQNELESSKSLQWVSLSFLQNKFFVDHLGLVEPTEEKMGHKFALGKNGFLKHQNAVAYDIPFFSLCNNF
uniref:C2H2-type domain-containing protein n=1 Tax=Amphimedon queenslandica TaxID=400682 RepID=A0A1X7UU47_AMPQE